MTSSCTKRLTSCCKSTFGFLSCGKTYDEKSLNVVERILLIKSQGLCAIKLILVAMSYDSDYYFIDKAEKQREKNFADVNLEFQEAILPTVKSAHTFINVALLLLLLLSFKWPKLGRTFFATDMINISLYFMVSSDEIQYSISA